MIHAVRAADAVRRTYADEDALPTYWASAAIPNLVGSLLSLVGTATVILLWIFARDRKRRDFRYALILNLTVAEFLNSLNNSASGVAVVSRRKPMLPGTACNFNGWAGQFSVQATDFSVLAIAVVTLLTIQLKSYIIYASTTVKFLICLSIWVVPLCTSLYALSKEYYGPVSGNWCWIQPHFKRQRYTLTHGWRLAVFIISLGIYVFVFIYMSRRLRPANLTSISISMDDHLDRHGFGDDDDDDNIHPNERHLQDDPAAPPTSSTRQTFPPDASTSTSASGPPASTTMKHRRHPSSFSFAHRNTPWSDPSQPAPLHLDTRRRSVPLPPTPPPASPTSPTSPPSFERQKTLDKPLPRSPAELGTSSHAFPAPNPAISMAAGKTTKVDREIWKMILLNMYPVTYLVLWIPGMANRIVEVTGGTSKALVILQCSTQFIGLANACVYVYKEHRGAVGGWWRGVGARLGARRRESIHSDETFEAASTRTFIKMRYQSSRHDEGVGRGVTPTTYYIP